jgi:Flp pilus assembly protein TadD
LENDGPWYLIDEAQELCKRVTAGDISNNIKIRSGLAYLSLQRGDEDGRVELEAITESEQAPAEALVLYGKILLNEEKVAQARRMFRRALVLVPNNPCIQSLLAKSYLSAGALYNSEYAKQLATQACQQAEWSSPRDMHILAEAYYHTGDKASALIIANKAKEEGNRLLGAYRDVKSLEQLIDSLQTSSAA